MNITPSDLKAAITAAVNEYIENEECYTDNVQLQIDTATGTVEIADPENDIEGCDYYPVMDLIIMSTTRPGEWLADEDAIDEVVAEYVTE